MTQPKQSFDQIFIEGKEENLPKESGNYFVVLKPSGIKTSYYYDPKENGCINIWMSEVNYWLRDRITSTPDKRDKIEPLSLEEALHEREALFQAFDKIRGCFKGRHWLMEGRGCYPWDDERYKEEVRYIMDEFDQINKDLWKQIKSKSFEYREKIKAPLLEKINQLESEIEKLKS